MANHVWTVLCNQVLIDPRMSGVISLVNVTEKIDIQDDLREELKRAHQNGRKGIFVIVRFHLVSWWTRSDPEKAEVFQARSTVVSPSNKNLSQQDISADLEKFRAQRVSIAYEEFPVTELGLHYFVIEQQSSKGDRKSTRWKTEARIPLWIV